MGTRSDQEDVAENALHTNDVIQSLVVSVWYHARIVCGLWHRKTVAICHVPYRGRILSSFIMVVLDTK